jgi:tRNA(adenine34) deaminase
MTSSLLADFSKMSDLERDVHFMKEALREAKKAYDKDEVPVGAVLVHKNKIIARGHNQVELLQDATAHAEMLAMTAGAAALGNWRLADTTLYCTLEPCCMCAGALLSTRVQRLVWAAPDVRLGANGSWVDLFSQKHPMHTLEITSGILEAESADLMRRFFQEKRKKKIYREGFKNQEMARRRPEFELGEAGAEAAQPERLGDGGKSQSQRLSDAARTDFSTASGINAN